MNFDIKRIKYEKNVGDKDQKIRYGAGSALLLTTLFMGNVPLLVLGGVLIASAYTRWCPIYSGLGKSTLEPGGIGQTGSAESPGEKE